MSDYDFPDHRLTPASIRDKALLADTRRRARRTCIRNTTTRADLRDALNALDLWPYDERDRP